MDDPLLTEKQVSEMTGLSVGTFQQWRFHGIGPAYYKLGAKAIRYKRSEILEYIESNRVVPALAGD